MSALINADAFQREVLGFAGTVLVDFFTDGCGPCRMMSPILDDIERDRKDVKVVKVDAAADAQLAANYNVSAVPTFVLLSAGQVKAQLTGARSKKDMLAWIDANR